MQSVHSLNPYLQKGSSSKIHTDSKKKGYHMCEMCESWRIDVWCMSLQAQEMSMSLFSFFSFRLQNEAMEWMEWLYQAVWRGDPREANDGQEEIQEHTIIQLQGQEGDPRL